MPGSDQHHIPLADGHAFFLQSTLQILGRHDLPDFHTVDVFVASHVHQHAAREKYADIFDAEFFEAIRLAKFGAAKAVIEVVVAGHSDADVPQAVKLSADLTDLAAENLVVIDHLIFTKRP